MRSKLREEAATRDITREELIGRALSIQDLAAWVRTSPEIEEHTRRVLLRNLFDSAVPVYVYSYTARDFVRALGPVSEREVAVREAFPSSRVHAVDTKIELYNNDEFDCLHLRSAIQNSTPIKCPSFSIT